MEQVLEDSGLSMPFLLLNDGYGSESFKQVDEIRGFVRRSECAPVELASLRTSAELRLFWERLADPACRLVALEEELRELELSLWHRSLWMACQVVGRKAMHALAHVLFFFELFRWGGYCIKPKVSPILRRNASNALLNQPFQLLSNDDLKQVPLAYVSVSSPGAGCLWTGPYVKREQEAFSELRTVIIEIVRLALFGVNVLFRPRQSRYCRSALDPLFLHRFVIFVFSAPPPSTRFVQVGPNLP